MKKNPEQTERTRQRLKDVYIEMLETDQKPTVDAVCRKAGYNRCTFYRYYPSTESILTEIEEDLRHRLHTLVLNAAEQNGQETFICGLATLYREKGSYIYALLRAGGTDFVDKMRQQIAPLVLRNFQLEDHPNKDVIVVFIANAISQTFLHWFRSSKKLNVDELITLVGKLINHGLSGLANTTTMDTEVIHRIPG